MFSSTRVRQRRGFTLIEVVVALGLLSVVSTALTRTVIAARRARASVEHSAAAVRLAEAGMEQLRGTGTADPVAAGVPFERQAVIEPWNAALHLYRLEVRVTSSVRPDLDIRLMSMVER